LLVEHHALACSPNDNIVHNKLKVEYNRCKAKYILEQPNTPLHLSVEQVDTAIHKLAPHSAAGHDSVVIEHFLFAHPSIVSILTAIFNIFLALGKVPEDFGLGNVTPLPKFNGHKIAVTPDDFRGITINTVASKNFEYCIVDYFV
jgi:hypothetical protein